MLPNVARAFSTAWPPAVGGVIPGAGVGVALERTWAPVLSYALVHALPGTADPQMLFDELDLRSALAESFAEAGVEGEESWRLAARVRLLLGGRVAMEALRTEGFWEQGDVRWLAGVNESEGISYVNKESFEQLLCWLQLPALLGMAGRLGGEDGLSSPAAALAEVEGAVRAECSRLEEAGYKLRAYLGEENEAEPEAVEGEALVR